MDGAEQRFLSKGSRKNSEEKATTPQETARLPPAAELSMLLRFQWCQKEGESAFRAAGVGLTPGRAAALSVVLKQPGPCDTRGCSYASAACLQATHANPAKTALQGRSDQTGPSWSGGQGSAPAPAAGLHLRTRQRRRRRSDGADV